jgi:hypothetical protein
MFWMTVKSGLRQWYVSGAAFLLISLLEMVLNLQIPTEVKGAFWLVAAQSLVKMAEKFIRAWVTGWSDNTTDIQTR